MHVQHCSAIWGHNYKRYSLTHMTSWGGLHINGRRDIGTQGCTINPLAPNDHCTGRYFATPECRMTSTLVTSGDVGKRVFSEAKGRSAAFQISSTQCLVFCCCFSTKMRDFRQAKYVKLRDSRRHFTATLPYGSLRRHEVQLSSSVLIWEIYTRQQMATG